MATDKLSSFDLMHFPSNADLSAKQYFAVVLTSGKTALAGAGALIVGILQNKPDAADKSASVAVKGISKAVAGAAITAGVGVTPDAAGKLVTTGATDSRSGIALTAAAADGDVFTMLVGIGAPQT